ncbi:FecR family protein [Pseudomaricurvus alkylphenolicus]|uniref:FecR family protein n=1 Tax=Pseudomaricurvus alkylphenolicus TaxID=1306991 RepID=UPI00141EE59E|nr:FecR family protein [Pseudomaricurvus alkylphenolicus]NIB39586.1 FecR family protein [Pseudomaricurvus alkylphenolicus]
MVDAVEDTDNIQDQARHWVIRLDGGEFSAEDQTRLDKWLQDSEQHRQAFEEAQAAWGLIDDFAALPEARSNQLQTMIDAEGIDAFDLYSIQAPPGVEFLSDELTAQVSASNFDAQEQPGTLEQPAIQAVARPAAGIADISGPRSHAWRQMATAAVVVLMISFGFYQFAPLPEGHYRTDRGQQLTHVLEDGSTITLNTDSYLVVDFSEDQRRLELRSGEAFFEVAHDSNRPFVVEAEGGAVTAVGTAFCVYDRGDDVQVTVTEGIVEVSASDSGLTSSEQQRLSLNQSLVYRSESEGIHLGRVTERPPQEVSQRLAWRQQKLYFDNTSLQSFVEQLNRYGDGRIVIMDPALQDLRIGGVFPTGDTKTALAALETSFDVDAVGVTPYLTLLYKKEPEHQ